MHYSVYKYTKGLEPEFNFMRKRLGLKCFYKYEYIKFTSFYKYIKYFKVPYLDLGIWHMQYIIIF